MWNNLDTDPDQDPNVSKLLSAAAKDKDLPNVVVAKSAKNSLNNRMLPLELITTDCVFQVDDDTRHLKPESIVSGFRAWQKNRDNLVGYQSRHAKAGRRGKWEYSNSGKEVSIILTTAAFHHKFYSYVRAKKNI